MNTVSLIGRLTTDPQVRTGSDHSSASFRLAVPRNSESADFVDIVTFDTLAATVADHLTRGRKVAVIGRLGHNQWTTPDGQKRSKLQVVADGVIFLDRPETKAGNGSNDEDDEPKSAQPAGRYRKRSA